MDADTYAALDQAADEAMREYSTQESRDRALAHARVLTDGVCRITSVDDSAFLPCVGYVFTDLEEKFPVFDVFTREQAKTLTGKRVKLSIRMSARGTRYIVGMLPMPVDTSTDVWPCPRCGGVARLKENPSEYIIVPEVGPVMTFKRDFYACSLCSYQMEVGS